jgi:flagellar assembly protein FliH
MSNSPVIPKEKLSAYQRWELHSFDTPANTLSADSTKAAAASAAADKVRHIHKQAYEAGRADGARERDSRTAAEALQLKAVLAAVEQQSGEINKSIAQDILALALEVARKMVHQSLAVHPELIVAVINNALAHSALPAGAATIALHPQDAALVREQIGDELAASGWRVVEDAGMLRGGALLQTAATRIDATMESRWQRMCSALGQSGSWLVSDSSNH